LKRIDGKTEIIGDDVSEDANEDIEDDMERKTYYPSFLLGVIAIATFYLTLGVSGIVCSVAGILLARSVMATHNIKLGFILCVIGFILGVAMLIVSLIRVGLGI